MVYEVYDIAPHVHGIFHEISHPCPSVSHIARRTSVQLDFIPLQDEPWQTLPQAIADCLELHLAAANCGMLPKQIYSLFMMDCIYLYVIYIYNIVIYYTHIYTYVCVKDLLGV